MRWPYVVIALALFGAFLSALVGSHASAIPNCTLEPTTITLHITGNRDPKTADIGHQDMLIATGTVGYGLVCDTATGVAITPIAAPGS